MPNTDSAKKALRQNLRRRARNLIRKKKMKDTIKTYKKLIAEGKLEEAKSFLNQVYIKENKARRLKSRLAKKLTVSS